MTRLYTFAATLATITFAALPAKAGCSGTGCYCTVSATATNFGLYDAVTKEAVDRTGDVEISCGSDTIGDTVSYEVELSKGIRGRYSARKLMSGSSDILYNLYTDVGRTTVWGDGKSGSVTVSDSYSLTVLCCEQRSYTAYGRIDAGQNAAPGIYSDSIIVTVSW